MRCREKPSSFMSQSRSFMSQSRNGTEARALRRRHTPTGDGVVCVCVCEKRRDLLSVAASLILAIRPLRAAQKRQKPAL
jgi:hypothetical protein